MFGKRKKYSLIDNVTDEITGWKLKHIIPAAGILASGWTKDNKVFLLSSDGYSISNIEILKREVRNYDEGNTVTKGISKDNLSISINEYKEPLKIFGIWGGDGNHFTEDSWGLEKFSQSLYEETIGIRNYKATSNEKEHWKNFQLIKLERLEYTGLKMGFSPNQKYFGIFGSGGAEIFERKK